jgi:3-carboxy-cis,cis-muconate cycloisomerase
MLSLAHTLERVAGTVSKIATDLAYMASSEVRELRMRPGGSSSMPGKENPIDAVRARAAAAACTGAAAMLRSGPPVELDRGVGGWHVERLAIPLAFQTCGAAVEAVNASLDTLEVDDELMRSRVPEPITLGLAAQIDAVLARAREEAAG